MSLGALVLAALAGSMHCGAMCGAFAAACGARGVSSVAAYQGGRLLGYLALGAAAGAAGAGVDAVGERLAGLQSVAALLMGALLVVLAVRVWRGPRTLVSISAPRRKPGPLARMLRRGGIRGAAGVGALTAFLPCGWLWGFVAVAAAAGNALQGMGVMAALWLGGLPLLLAVGGLADRLRAHTRGFARPVVAACLLTAGLWSLTGHWLPRLLPTADPLGADAQCHRP